MIARFGVVPGASFSSCQVLRLCPLFEIVSVTLLLALSNLASLSGSVFGVRVFLSEVGAFLLPSLFEQVFLSFCSPVEM